MYGVQGAAEQAPFTETLDQVQYAPFAADDNIDPALSEPMGAEGSTSMPDQYVAGRLLSQEPLAGASAVPHEQHDFDLAQTPFSTAAFDDLATVTTPHSAGVPEQAVQLSSCYPPNLPNLQNGPYYYADLPQHYECSPVTASGCVRNRNLGLRRELPQHHVDTSGQAQSQYAWPRERSPENRQRLGSQHLLEAANQNLSAYGDWDPLAQNLYKDVMNNKDLQSLVDDFLLDQLDMDKHYQSAEAFDVSTNSNDLERRATARDRAQLSGTQTLGQQTYQRPLAPGTAPFLDANTQALDRTRSLAARQKRNTALKAPLSAPRSRYEPSQACIACRKTFRPPKDTAEQQYSTEERERCTRCRAKWKRHESRDTPPDFPFLSTEGTFENAITHCFQQYGPVNLPGDDFEDHQRLENVWVQRFLAAAKEPYVDSNAHYGLPNEAQDRAYKDQQEVLNQKPYQNPGKRWYEPEWVNRRFVLLFHAAINFHKGGPRPYAHGGDNFGYGNPDTKLKCSDRLKEIVNILRYDKRTVINVIEGRGVCAFAENPKQFAKRKVQNKSSNNTKKKQIDEGKSKLAGISESVETRDDGEDGDDDDREGLDGRSPSHLPRPIHDYEATGEGSSTTDPGALDFGNRTYADSWPGMHASTPGEQTTSGPTNPRKRKAVDYSERPVGRTAIPIKRARARVSPPTRDAAMLDALPLIASSDREASEDLETRLAEGLRAVLDKSTAGSTTLSP